MRKKIVSTAGSSGGKFAGIPAEVIPKILDGVPEIVGWKMVTEDPKGTSAALRGYTGRHVVIFPAGANSFEEFIKQGLFDGTLSGFWNYSQELMSDAVVAYRDEKNEAKFHEIWNENVTKLHDTVSGVFPKGENRLHSAYKTATWLRGLISNPYPRGPMCKLRVDEVKLIRDAMKKCDIETISDAAIKKIYPTFA